MQVTRVYYSVFKAAHQVLSVSFGITAHFTPKIIIIYALIANSILFATFSIPKDQSTANRSAKIGE